jgi:dCMP deaminase
MRPSKHITFLKMAKVLSEQSTCARRNVGCVLVDCHNHIIGSGYNGNAASLPHCIDVPCAGATLASNQGLELCEAIHAEQNALMQCNNIEHIAIAYCTTSPCVHCTKMLLNTFCHTIIFCEKHASFESSYELWRRSGRVMEQYLL